MIKKQYDIGKITPPIFPENKKQYRRQDAFSIKEEKAGRTLNVQTEAGHSLRKIAGATGINAPHDE